MASSSTLSQTALIIAFTSNQKKSQSLSTNLKLEQKQAIRGYLQLEAGQLRSNGTIREVRLPELEPLIDKCHVVLIESDESQKFEFKLVFRETKFQICGADKVLQEHVLLNFEILPQKLKAMREAAKASTDKDKKDEAGAGNDPGAGGEAWAFDPDDALAFDPAKFLNLLTQMERQKSAYVLLAEGAPDGSKSRRGKSKA